MVENLSRQGHIEHLLPDLPGALVPTYSQLIEADVPEVLCRRLVQFVSDELEPEELAQPDSIRAALVRRRSSSAFRSRRRSGRCRARGGSWPWWARPGSARRRRSPSWRRT